MGAERFPGDYDGIIAGAPAPDLTHLMVAFLWNWRAAMDHAGGQIPPAKLALVARAAVAACAGPAERALGFIANPDQCRFDPGTLLCQTPDAADCLTAAQVDTIWKIYAGPSNPQTGALIFPGLEPGSEAGWAPQEEGPQPLFTAFFRDFLFDDPHWDPTGFSFAHDPARLDAKLALPLNAGNPDLSAFRAHGGKLILFHGWADPLIAPMSTVHFYQQIIDAAYGDKLAETRRFARLFMIPGMGHCGGGNGPSLVDWDSAIEAWVEQGKAPDQLSAVKLAEGGQSQVVTATRPVCAWPEAARWNGTGKPTEFSSFFCAIPDRS
jgi:feruloyl esterase